MRIRWTELGSEAPRRALGRTVLLTGFPAAQAGLRHADKFLLAPEPACCPGCVPASPLGHVAVEALSELPLTAGALHLTGRWEAGDAGYRLTEARLAQPAGWSGVTRRGALAGGPLICLGAATRASAADVLRSAPAIDAHSHAGGLASVRRIRIGQTFDPVAAPMRQGGVAAVCLAIVSDGPTHRIMPDGRLHPYREPEPGELYEYAQLAFAAVHRLAREQGLAIATNAAGLRAAPAAVIAAEGADFLEGRPDRVEEAYRRWSLRHLQLTHYRVNELGDIQTEPPVHGGLTDTGAEVIRWCNRLGVVVDVAHGTFDLVKRAASVTTRPLVLSHTSLTARPGRFSRQVTADHARLVAQTGGLVGVWPPASIYPSLDAMAAGIARLADVVGIDHVGLGSDMRGLVGPSVLPDYDRVPALAEALLKAGFSPADAGKVLGGNYARVFAACCGAG